MTGRHGLEMAMGFQQLGKLFPSRRTGPTVLTSSACPRTAMALLLRSWTGPRSSISDSGSCIVPLGPHCFSMSSAKLTSVAAASSLRGWSLGVDANHDNSCWMRCALFCQQSATPPRVRWGASRVVLEFTLEFRLGCEHIPQGCPLGQ